MAEGLLSFRGADLTINFYVGNADVNTSVDVMKTGIESQGVAVVGLEEIQRRHNRFKSFKLCIKKKDVETIKDPNFWPEGVAVRRFFQKTNSDNGPSARMYGEGRPGRQVTSQYSYSFINKSKIRTF